MVTDFAPPMVVPQTSTVIAEPSTRPKRKVASKTNEALQASQKRKRSSPSVIERDQSLASTPTCPPTISPPSAPSRQKRRQIIEQQQIQNKSIVTTIQNRTARNKNEEAIFSVGPCTPVQAYPTQYYVLPNYEGHENSMTVREAECTYKSDFD